MTSERDMHTRQNVWKLSSQPWPDTLLWYAKAVRELQSRPTSDLTSWTSLGAMHGFDKQLWIAFGYITASTALPSAADQAKYWKQCQHQSWYFLPWHRGYLVAFEAIVRAAVVKLGGPDSWALPYWNYSDTHDPNALKMPTAFSATKLPDGSANPLFVTRRYGDGTGHVVIKPSDVTLGALTQSQFAGPPGGGGPTGFGGPQTAFQHDGTDNGQLERQPHNGVHGLVGGQKPGTNPTDPRSYGLMSMPDTAGLDPIFWLHHANIDRLWVVWRQRTSTHLDPTDAAWLTGPASRSFAMPRPNGTGYTFTAHDVVDTKTLGYTYDDTSDPLGGTHRLMARLNRLALPPAMANAQEIAVAERKPSELLGSNKTAVRISGPPVETAVRLDTDVKDKLIRSFSARTFAAPTAAPAGGTAPIEPDRVFLTLENIRGANDSAVFYVYIDLPKDAKPEDNPDHLAGVVSLFGVRKASNTDSPHGGNGINETIEITDVIDKLHLSHKLDADQLNIRFVSRTEISPEDGISVGGVSVYRQGD
jgi:tyrosinase